MCVCACYCPWISKTYEFVLETALHFRGHSKFQTPFYNHVPMLNQNNPRLIIASTSISDRDLQLMKTMAIANINRTPIICLTRKYGEKS